MQGDIMVMKCVALIQTQSILNMGKCEFVSKMDKSV